MSQQTLFVPSTPGERVQQAERLTHAQPYGKPRRVWVDDGHVFVQGHDGTLISMTPEVAIEMSRLLGQAGAESLINKVMDHGAAEAQAQSPATG